MIVELCLILLPSLYTASEGDLNILNKILDQPILAQNEFKFEIQRFLKNRIPPLELPDTWEEWEDKSDTLRKKILKDIVFHNVPKNWYKNKPQVVWGEVIETQKGYRIRKLRYEALPGLWIPALLYEPVKESEKIPAVLNVNGHVGPPGKTIDYEQIRCINLAKRGILALHPEWLVFGELSHDDYKHNRLAYLDLCGTSGLSVFFLAMKRGIDVLEGYSRTDAKRIAMTGLSGGGWQTIILSSLDTRISATAPNAGYIGLDYRADFRGDIGDLEQNPNDLLTIADYTHLTAMLAPRKALLIYNEKDDCCFQAYRARKSVFEPIVPFYQLAGKEENFQYHENRVPGTHNYDKDNREQFYRFINRCFLPESEWNDSEIPSDDEVMKYEDLLVGIPENNANFFTLASELMKDLPRKKPKDNPEDMTKWQIKAIKKLRKILRVKDMKFQASIVSEGTEGNFMVKRYKLTVNRELTIPMAVISRIDEKPGPVVILMSDKGKRTLGEEISELTKKGMTVIAVDPIFTGESMSEDCPFWQYAQMVSAVGERTLGIQTAQVSAVMSWACREFKVDKVTVYGVGWNTSIVALTATGLHNSLVKELYIRDYPESLKILIENHVDYEQKPALFCFGLLERFDIPELTMLCSPVQVIKERR